MKSTANHRAKQPHARVPTSATQQKRERGCPRIISFTLWGIGVLILAGACFVVHTHPASWPFELTVIKDLQGPHPVPCNYAQQPHSWIDSGADIINTLNDPLQAVALPIAWMLVLMIFRLFLQALFLGAAVGSSSGMWFLLERLVARPRITPADDICVHRAIAAYSFPSGHVIHDVVLYGFLLYLSFTPPVRRWRYHWLLLPLQVLAVLYLLAIGFARLEAGEHHLLDVIGAYLAGILWLFLFIFLYHWTTELLARRRSRRPLNIPSEIMREVVK
jgi:membrane-associated phospholipid phosphatase